MRRVILLITAAIITTLTLVINADWAFADACFDDVTPPGIGPVVGDIASNLAGPPKQPTPGSGVPIAPVSVLNQAKEAVCP